MARQKITENTTITVKDIGLGPLIVKIEDNGFTHKQAIAAALKLKDKKFTLKQILDKKNMKKLLSK